MMRQSETTGRTDDKSTACLITGTLQLVLILTCVIMPANKGEGEVVVGRL